MAHFLKVKKAKLWKQEGDQIYTGQSVRLDCFVKYKYFCTEMTQLVHKQSNLRHMIYVLHVIIQ